MTALHKIFHEAAKHVYGDGLLRIGQVEGNLIGGFEQSMKGEDQEAGAIRHNEQAGGRQPVVAFSKEALRGLLPSRWTHAPVVTTHAAF